MKKLITTLLLLLSIGVIYSYDFRLDLKTNSVKDYTCTLQYDDKQLNLSFDKGFSHKLIKKEVNDNLSLVCSVPITIIRMDIYNNDRELIYTDQVGSKRSYYYKNTISHIQLELKNANTCSIRTDAKVEKFKLNKNTDLDLDIINLYSMSCNSSLEGSTIRLYDDTNYNIKYKVFTKNEKTFTIDLDKPVINYKNKVELYLRPYDSKDEFKCATFNNDDKVEFTNTDKKLMLYKTFYSTDNFKLNCDYKFKQIQLFALDSYFDKDISEFDYYNVSTINTQLNVTIKKVIKKVIQKVKVKTPKPEIKTNIVNITKEEIKVTPQVFQGAVRPTTDIDVFRKTGVVVNILRTIFTRENQNFTMDPSTESNAKKYHMEINNGAKRKKIHK